MGYKAKIVTLGILAAASIVLFLFSELGANWEYALTKRSEKILAIVLTGGAIAFSTMVFQTITNNRILTPSIIGLDSLYLLIQTLLIFLFGSANLTMMDKNINFLLSVVLMVLFAGVLYNILFKREGQNIYFLLLVGLIFGTFFQSISSFLQVLIDPNEFLVVQDRMFASFNNINTDLLLLAGVALILMAFYFAPYMKYLDVLSLGREPAINLGIAYDEVVKRLLLGIAVLVSISTALTGPLMFLGLLVANITHEFVRSYQHKYLLVGSVLISIIALVGGQFVVERVFTFSTTLSVIINFVGGVYFLYLLLKENRSW